MHQWPSLRTVVSVWAALSVVAYVAYVAYVTYLHSLPRDELVMANDLSFQALGGLVAMGLPALFFLLWVVFVRSIAKRWLTASSAA